MTGVVPDVANAGLVDVGGGQERPSTSERVARVLLAFADGDRCLGVSEIARRLQLSKAVVHRILQTLVGTGLVSFAAGDHTYRLGPAAHALARHADHHSELRAAAVPVINRLALVTGETTILSARNGYRRIYVHQVESDQPVRITISLGRSYPLTVGANGLAVLARLPDDDVEQALRVPLEKYTERTVTDPAAIRARLIAIRRQGWASSSGERVPMSTSIAAAVLDAHGSPVGSLSVGFLTSRFSDQSFDEMAALVRDAGEEASQRFQQADE
ncbi:IclR family transcriptional regulator [Kineococcus arenarius]|uniref:IclR family transcriptional regulator n=1 Tax=unclassified Kineococcus TaxID=2621656 RepID=UPI003D7D20B2